MNGLLLPLSGLYRRIGEKSAKPASGLLHGRQPFSLIRRASAMRPEPIHPRFRHVFTDFGTYAKDRSAICPHQPRPRVSTLVQS